MFGTSVTAEKVTLKHDIIRVRCGVVSLWENIV